MQPQSTLTQRLVWKRFSAEASWGTWLGLRIADLREAIDRDRADLER